MAKVYGPKTFVGKIKKAKDSERRYFQADCDLTIHGKNGDVKVKKGDYINLQTPDDQIADYHKAVEAGRMSEDAAAEKIASAEKDKSYGVRFTMIQQTVTDN